MDILDYKNVSDSDVHRYFSGTAVKDPHTGRACVVQEIRLNYITLADLDGNVMSYKGDKLRPFFDPATYRVPPPGYRTNSRGTYLLSRVVVSGGVRGLDSRRLSSYNLAHMVTDRGFVVPKQVEGVNVSERVAYSSIKMNFQQVAAAVFESPPDLTIGAAADLALTQVHRSQRINDELAIQLVLSGPDIPASKTGVGLICWRTQPAGVFDYATRKVEWWSPTVSKMAEV